jgi:hypothetical protein
MSVKLPGSRKMRVGVTRIANTTIQARLKVPFSMLLRKFMFCDRIASCDSP